MQGVFMLSVVAPVYDQVLLNIKFVKKFSEEALSQNKVNFTMIQKYIFCCGKKVYIHSVVWDLNYSLDSATAYIMK